MFCDHLAVILSSSDATTLSAFYQNTMGLSPVHDPNAACDGLTMFAAGRTGQIGIRSPPAELIIGPTAMWLEAGYVDHAYEILHVQRHAPLLVDLMDTYYGAREFQVLDPDGNITCVINYAKDLPERKKLPPGQLYAGEFRAVLYVKNLAACRRFYTEVLGLEIVYQWEEDRGDRGYKYALCPSCNSYIETLFREPLAIQRQATLVLVARSLETCYKGILDRAPSSILIPLGSNVMGHPGFMISDPDGNLIVTWGNMGDS